MYLYVFQTNCRYWIFFKYRNKKGPEKTYKPAKQHCYFILNVFI